MLLRVAVVDEEPRVDPSAAGLEPVPRVAASDPPAPRDHLPSVRIAPEQLDDADRPALAGVPVVVHADKSTTDTCFRHSPNWRCILARAAVIREPLREPVHLSPPL